MIGVKINIYNGGNICFEVDDLFVFEYVRIEYNKINEDKNKKYSLIVKIFI